MVIRGSVWRTSALGVRAAQNWSLVVERVRAVISKAKFIYQAQPSLHGSEPTLVTGR